MESAQGLGSSTLNDWGRALRALDIQKAYEGLSTLKMRGWDMWALDDEQAYEALRNHDSRK